MEKILLSLLPGIGKSVCQLRRELINACHSSGPVVLYGEKGTGKDHAAGIIHRITGDSQTFFYKINLGVEADRNRFKKPGNGGCTFYLDHCEAAGNADWTRIREMASSIPSGSRLILSLTTVPGEDGRCLLPPSSLPRKKRFVAMPPLRKRREDIPLLIRGLLEGEQLSGSTLLLKPEDLEYLYSYHWPGNLFELKQWIEDRLGPQGSETGSIRSGPGGSYAGGFMDRHIDAWVGSLDGSSTKVTGVLSKVTGQVEKSLIRAVLARTEGNQVEASAFLGINRNTLAKKIKNHGLVGYAGRKSAKRGRKKK